MNILVTGFSSFPGVPVNPCEEVLAWIEQTYPSTVLTVCLLPVSYARSATKLAQHIQANVPDVVIEFGVSNRSSDIRLESMGYNARNAGIPDVDGVHCAIQSIDQTLPYNCVKETVWPVDLLYEYLKERSKIGITVSTNPGRYVCNNLYWETLHRFSETPSLFVHIPPVDDTNRSSVLKTVGMLLDWAVLKETL